MRHTGNIVAGAIRAGLTIGVTATKVCPVRTGLAYWRRARANYLVRYRKPPAIEYPSTFPRRFYSLGRCKKFSLVLVLIVPYVLHIRMSYTQRRMDYRATSTEPQDLFSAWPVQPANVQSNSRYRGNKLVNEWNERNEIRGIFLSGFFSAPTYDIFSRENAFFGGQRRMEGCSSANVSSLRRSARPFRITTSNERDTRYEIRDGAEAASNTRRILRYYQRGCRGKSITGMHPRLCLGVHKSHSSRVCVQRGPALIPPAAIRQRASTRPVDRPVHYY